MKNIVQNIASLRIGKHRIVKKKQTSPTPMKGSENDLERLGSKWSAAVVSTRDVSWRRRGGNRPKLSPPAAAGPPPPPQTHPEKGLAVETAHCLHCREGRGLEHLWQVLCSRISRPQLIFCKAYSLHCLVSTAPIIAQKTLIYVMAGILSLLHSQ